MQTWSISYIIASRSKQIKRITQKFVHVKVDLWTALVINPVEFETLYKSKD